MIGRSFPLPVLEHLIASDDLEADLSALLRADIIREVRHYPEAEYTFRHGLLREASLSDPAARPRRELHGAVAAAFETQFATTLDDHLEVLAHYYARSEDLAKALDYLERAGEKAAALDATPHAGRAWRRAEGCRQARRPRRRRARPRSPRPGGDRRRDRLVAWRKRSKPSRIGLIADIHGNALALDRVLGELEREGVDDIICLGDVAVGPQPAESLERVGRSAAGRSWATGTRTSRGFPAPKDEIGERLVEIGAWWAEQLSPSTASSCRRSSRDRARRRAGADAALPRLAAVERGLHLLDHARR